MSQLVKKKTSGKPMNEQTLKWLRHSRAYKKASSLVQTTIASPEKLLNLVTKAQSKAVNKAHGRLSEVIGTTSASFRLLKKYAAGEYRDISAESLALIVASIIYFVMPIDVIPDFILALGFTDDAALLAWTFRSVSSDIERFIDWEKQDKPSSQNKETN